MPKMFVLFNLKDGVDSDAYEEWARTRDAVIVRKLPSIDSFAVVRIDGSMQGESPFQYVEQIEINDMGRFHADIATQEMAHIAAEFQEWADAPLFIHGDEVA
jgi:uncharacterized protein (TIGR02118 family)